VGNPQALGAKPLTFVRQVVALCAAPFLLDHPDVETLFPSDAVARARKLVASFGTGGVGGYTDSRGNTAIREEVADFIQRRDGHRPGSEVRRRRGWGAVLGVFWGSRACSWVGDWPSQ
jgi:aspartate/methionine/tyrosine aminotransferase